MSKVLVFSSASPIPVIDGAAIGVFQKLTLFSSLGYEVDCAYIESKKIQKKAFSEDLNNYCGNVFRFPFSKKMAFLRVLLGLFKNTKPLQVNYFYSGKIQKWVDEHVGEYDLIWCMEIRMSEYLKKYNNKVIFDYVDCISENCRISLNNCSGIWKILNYIEYKRCSRYERKIASVFNTRVVITEHDKRCLFPNAEYSCHVMPNYVSINAEKIIDQQNTDDNIVFIGSMFYAPNVVAAKYFVKNVLPNVVKTFPNVKFFIVGNRPTKEVLELQSKNVIVTGFVENVWDYLKNASVIVVPMLTGSGLQNKILEGLSVKGCVVTTRVCSEGLVHAEGMPYVANTSQEMSQQIINLLKDKKLRIEVGNKSFDYVRHNYSFEVVSNILSSIIKESKII